MTERPEKVSVHVMYKDLEKTFSGSAEETWLLVNSFFSELLPTFEIATHLWLNTDLQKLAEQVEGIIAFSPEGPLLLLKNRLTDNETLILWLTASFLGKNLGLLERDTMSKEELQAKLAKSGKITSTRLGELVKNGLVARTDEDEFKITTFGVLQVQKDLLPKIRAKTGN